VDGVTEGVTGEAVVVGLGLGVRSGVFVGAAVDVGDGDASIEAEGVARALATGTT
jgi:hypothetical protein